MDNGIIANNTFSLVRDIDFEANEWLDNPMTFNKILQSSFEGNDMELSNYNIYKAGDVDSIGLFASIETAGLGTYVRNLTLKPASIKASNSGAVGALAGTIDSVRVYNITIDSGELMILGKNAVGGLAGIVKGSFEVIGITSNVSTFATFNHTTSEQYNLYMGKNELGETFIDDRGRISYVDNIDKVSYSGAVVGIADGYNNANPKNNRDIVYYYPISQILLNGDLKVIGETVGGAFGLIGQRTLVKDLNYNLTSDAVYQGVYVSGGLVGESRGIIQNSNIYAYTYDNGSKQDVDTSKCFDNFARVNGGIVGVNIGGLINNCTSDINVSTTKTSATAGGIVGRNLGGSIYGCTVSGSVNAFYAGGIAGSDYTYETIKNQSSGTGTATYETRQVYDFIKDNRLEYKSNCFVNSQTFTQGMLYSENVFTKDFIDSFVSQKDKYYSFNKDYGKDGAKFTNASSVLGLVIGLSDVGLNNKYYNASVVIENNELTISLTIQDISDKAERTKYRLSEDDTREIEPITTIQLQLNKYDIYDMSFIYIIAYSHAGYEFWSSSIGYGDDYIVISPRVFE